MRRLVTQSGVAVRLTVVVMLVTGIIYPLAMTGAAQALFHDRANGSLVRRDGQVIGSSLIGQNFTAAKYFHGRPSSTTDANGTPQPYNAASSAASNLGPTNPALIRSVEQNADAVRCAEGLPAGPTPLVPATPASMDTPCAPVTQNISQVPVDAVASSASGLDPDISVAYAMLQVHRVAQARNLQDGAVQKLVEDQTADRQFGVLGERRLNVLELNLALDRLNGP